MALKQNKETPSGPGKDPNDAKIEVGGLIVDPAALPVFRALDPGSAGATSDASVDSEGSDSADSEDVADSGTSGTIGGRQSGGIGGSGGSGSGKSKGSSGGSGGAGKPRDKDKKSNPVSQLAEFVHEVVVEFRKITWPPFSQTVRETWSVLFLVTVITLMVLGFDWFLGRAIFGPLDYFARMHGGGVGLR